jgi:hypothetical protein
VCGGNHDANITKILQCAPAPSERAERIGLTVSPFGESPKIAVLKVSKSWESPKTGVLKVSPFGESLKPEF